LLLIPIKRRILEERTFSSTNC